MQDHLKDKIRTKWEHRKRRRRRRRRPRLKRGIFLLPNLFTTGSLFAGFYAIIAAIQMDFWWASLAILISIILDGLDGAIARLTKSSSPFGLQYDSLSDLAAFGIAPAILIYNWALAPFGRIGWLAAFIFTACSALRLARFNVFAQTAGPTADFRGLPAPAAAGVLASWVFMAEHYEIREMIPPALTFAYAYILATLAYLLAFLMVSTIRYTSFKNLGDRLRRPFRVLVGTVLALFVAAAIPQVVAFLAMAGYAISGPVLYFHRYRRTKEAAAPSEEPAAPESP
ncbi:CDP-diacylglycerol--serine O-phosphatidyltransferase [Nitrospinota bacterium]